MAASKSRPPSLPERLAASGAPAAAPAASSAPRGAGSIHQGLPRIRAGMGEVGSAFVEVWSDDDYRRATGLGRVLAATADGRIDPAAGGLVPRIAPAVLRQSFRSMLCIGAAFADGRRREAAIVGAATAVKPEDTIFPGSYAPGVAIVRGQSVEAAITDGATPPRALRVVPPSPFRATQLPQATGLAWAARMQKRADVALAFLDGPATSAEDFHAGLNFAGVYKAPVVFVCINGLGAAAAVETVSETIAVKALAYGVGADRVDGGDFLAVYRAVAAAAERARAGGGATLVEAVVDLGDAAPDPVRRMAMWLAAEKVLDAPAEQALRDEVDAEVQAASRVRRPVLADPGA